MPLRAQMVNPSIDRAGQPFSYFSKPTDEIGILDSQAATEVTPEGYLRTGYGELMFFAGPDYEPINVRIRTLEQGHLPILHYSFQRDGIDYDITVFGTSLDLTPDGKLPDSGPSNASLVNFIRVEMKNAGAEPNRAIFATGMRYDAPNDTADDHGDNRFTRPAEPEHEGGYRQLGEKFSARTGSTLLFTRRAAFLSRRPRLYTFPADIRRAQPGPSTAITTTRRTFGKPRKARRRSRRPRRHRHLFAPAQTRRVLDPRLHHARSPHLRSGADRRP